MKTPKWFRASSGDVHVVIVVAVVTIVLALTELVRRLAEVLPNRDVPVEIAPEAVRAEVPLGPEGELVGADIGSIIVQVSDLPPATYAGVLGASVVYPVVWIVVAFLGIGLCRALLRGAVFTPANTLRVNLIAAVILGGAALHLVFATFQHNGVLAVLSAPDHPSGGSLQVDFLPWFGGLALAAFAMAFTIGEKLQRDSEGLV